MADASAERADRLHAALSATFEGFFSVIEEANFERRVGHSRLLFPSVPLALFNGVVVESEPCSGITDSIREVEAAGVPCGVPGHGRCGPALESLCRSHRNAMEDASSLRCP
jgi:hypothetical protein